MLTQPSSSLQLSVVHGLSSSQSSEMMPAHTPCWQVSALLHALPSSQGRALGMNLQPAVASQASSVHGF